MKRPATATLREAENLLHGERQEQYGDPVQALARVALVWQGITGHPFTAHQVALCMAGLKLARAGHKHAPDHVIDAAAYVLVAAVAAEEETVR